MLLTSLKPNAMYVTPSGVIYKANGDGELEVASESDIQHFVDNAGAKKSRRKEPAQQLQPALGQG